MTTQADWCKLCFPYAMDQLPPDTQNQFANHLTKCESCQREYEEFKTLRTAVEEDIAQDAAKPHVPQRRRQFGRRNAGIGIAAAALALVVLLPEQDALADRLQMTAAHVHTGIAHQVYHLDSAARHLGSAAHHLYSRVHIKYK
jgi:ferric-dicitrate binding protein FerR (iron transport regulator)